MYVHLRGVKTTVSIILIHTDVCTFKRCKNYSFNKKCVKTTVSIIYFSMFIHVFHTRKLDVVYLVGVSF